MTAPDLVRRDAVLADLRARLSEPHRRYHGQAHIDAMLADLDARRDTIHDPEAVELAMWFHDAVYVPSAAENERASAVLLRAAMAGITPDTRLAAAEAMVLATEHHTVRHCHGNSSGAVKWPVSRLAHAAAVARFHASAASTRN